MPQNSLLSSPLFAHLFFLFLTKNDFSKIIYLNIFSNLLFVSKSSAALVNTIKSYLVKMCSLWHFKPPPPHFHDLKPADYFTNISEFATKDICYFHNLKPKYQVAFKYWNVLDLAQNYPQHHETPSGSFWTIFMIIYFFLQSWCSCEPRLSPALEKCHGRVSWGRHARWAASNIASAPPLSTMDSTLSMFVWKCEILSQCFEISNLSRRRRRSLCLQFQTSPGLFWRVTRPQ